MFSVYNTECCKGVSWRLMLLGPMHGLKDQAKVFFLRDAEVPS